MRGNFFRGETFIDLTEAQRRVEDWRRTTAGLRIHGTTAQRPAEHFAVDEQPLLLALPATPYDLPDFATPKVAPGQHVEVRALSSAPGELVGQRVETRDDSRRPVKIYPRAGDEDPSAQASPSDGVMRSGCWPWSSMRAVYRLLSLTRSCGTMAVNAACACAVELDVVEGRNIARMLELASDRQPAPPAAKVVGGTARCLHAPGHMAILLRAAESTA